MSKADSKYFRTAVKFDKALLSLLEKKSFDYITVSELCAEAGVNRSTFYLHYENTADLLQETIRYLLEDFRTAFSNAGTIDPYRLSDAAPEELIFIQDAYLRPYLSYIRENRHAFAAVLSHQNTFRCEDLFQRLFDHIFDPILDRFRFPVDDRRYVMLFYLNGLTAIVQEWLKNDCRKSIEEISVLIQYCIFGRDA